MENPNAIQLIDEKLAELDSAFQHNTSKGNLNFGIQVDLYKDSPLLPYVMNKKKNLVRSMWVTSFFISLMLTIILSEWPETGVAWWKIILRIIIMSITVNLIFVYFSVWSIVRKANDFQMEVKKMILLDLKEKLNR